MKIEESKMSIFDEIREMTDFEHWTDTGRSISWLKEHRATKLGEAWGFIFWENPICGDESPVLATFHEGTTVYNTQDFDLPVLDPMMEW